MALYSVADDLTRPLLEVVEAAEARAFQLEAADGANARLYERGWRRCKGHWIPPSIEWPQLLTGEEANGPS